MLAALIRAGEQVDATCDDGSTALTLAAREGHERIVLLLLESQPAPGFVDAADADGATALLLACRHGHPSVAHALMQAGARTDARLRDGSAVLHAAAGSGIEAVVSLLLCNQICNHICNHICNDTFVSLRPQERFLRFNNVLLPQFYGLIKAACLAPAYRKACLATLAEHRNWSWGVRFALSESARLT